jgi:ribonuclease-3 family protein
MFLEGQVEPSFAKLLSLKQLAHLGDAVFDLFERERQVQAVHSAKQMHKEVVLRVSAISQADLLDSLAPRLSEEEADIVRRARNMKASGRKKAGQGLARKSTAFEALLGYLYLTDSARLKEILAFTAN